MTLIRPKPPGRFSPPRLFAPESVAVIGADTAAGGQVLANLLAGGFQGAVLPVAQGKTSVGGVLTYPDVASLPIIPELAVLARDGAPLLADIAALGVKGTFAAVAVGATSGIAEAARASGVRVLGPDSFGIAVPRIGLNATRGHLPPKLGRLALVSQSAALCRAVLDWAEPNGVGFSHIVGVGGNVDIGFSIVLDWLSRDPGTGAILLDIRHLRNPRAFISASRAASRVRPVVAIRASGRLHDPTGNSYLAVEAALGRAGILSVDRFEHFLAAAETLTRARALRGETLAIATNAVGLGQFAADAALHDGLPLATLSPETREALRPLIPEADGVPEAERVPESGPIYVGLDRPGAVADAAARLGEAAEVGGVLAVLAPSGAADAEAVAALASRAGSLRSALLVAAMGETTGAAHRRRLAAAGLPVFASPEQAVRGFLHLLKDRRNRAAARELPSREVLTVTPDRGRVRAIIASARAAGRLELTAEESGWVFAAYGMRTPEQTLAHGHSLLIRVWDDPCFGPVIGLSAAGSETGQRAADLPPLNLPLARALIQRAGSAIPQEMSDEGREALAQDLVRVSQLIVDFPEIASLSDVRGRAAPDARIVLRAPDDIADRLSIAPYPAELTEEWSAKGERVTIRPIRPEDAEEHGAFFHRLSPEDVRFRFFSSIRELLPEQIARVTQVDYDREMAFVAVRTATGETVGVGRLACEADLRSAEFAVAVQPDMKRKGLGAHLMERLIDWARARGVAEIVGQILAENAPMLTFVRHLGFDLHRMHGEEDVVEARLRLVPES